MPPTGASCLDRRGTFHRELADLSPIGVSILSEKQFPVGTAIEVHFGAEESEVRGRLNMRAIVRHCEKGQNRRSFCERGARAARGLVENHA